jgi:hypothetical protein
MEGGTFGELAQLVERCDRTAEVRDSSSLFSIARNPVQQGVSLFMDQEIFTLILNKV